MGACHQSRSSTVGYVGEKGIEGRCDGDLGGQRNQYPTLREKEQKQAT
jgi:hypothetical protein